MWVLFSAWRSGDSALDNSVWMAEQTVKRAPPHVHLHADRAARDDLADALADPAIMGVVLFGHGTDVSVLGSKGEAVLDENNLELIRGRWAHALACSTGHKLARLAQPHAEIFVGYRARLVVEWNVADLAEPLRERLASLATAVTLALLDGVRDERELKQRAALAADELTAWINEHEPDGYLGVLTFAEILVDRLVTSIGDRESARRAPSRGRPKSLGS